jgi:hypothetical protein
MLSQRTESNIVTVFEDAILDYCEVDNLWNRIFNRNKIKEAKHNLFRKYQLACAELTIKYDEYLKELIDRYEEEIL